MVAVGGVVVFSVSDPEGGSVDDESMTSGRDILEAVEGLTFERPPLLALGLAGVVLDVAGLLLVSLVVVCWNMVDGGRTGRGTFPSSYSSFSSSSKGSG